MQFVTGSCCEVQSGHLSTEINNTSYVPAQLVHEGHEVQERQRH